MSTEAERELRIKILGAVAIVLLVCATVAGIAVPTERWEKLGHFLTDPVTAIAFSTLGGAAVALYLRAKASPAAGLLLVLALGAGLQGCTAAQTAETLHVIKTAVPWVCGGAKKLCEALGDAEACAAIALVCDVGEAVLGSEEGTGPADQQSVEHTLSEEP